MDSRCRKRLTDVALSAMSWPVDHLRPRVSFVVLAFFLAFMFVSGIREEVKKHHVQPVFPEFGHYAGGFVKTIPDNLFPIDDLKKRIIVIGDIHGMNSSLADLLDEVLYNPSKDTIIHLGDLVTKADVSDSIHVLSFMTSNKILGVRGNNDQKVIEWGAWMDWILSRSGGWEWLAAMDKQFPDLDGDNQRKVVINWVKTSKYADWENLVPKGWHLLGNHYRVARAMSREHFNYLRSLPLVLHSPASHSFFVHAGLLPSNPKFPAFDPTQPLSHWPAAADDQRDIAKLRIMQELAVLSDIPQNNDPWIVMNIRGVAHNGNVSTSNKKGTPWSQLWNDTMAECSGMNVRGTYKPTSLPCYPFTVIYGHAASRGLDIKRWSVGLDTGCAYGRRLSALVLDESSMSPITSGDNALPRAPQSQQIDFGDSGRARIISIACNGGTH